MAQVDLRHWRLGLVGFGNVGQAFGRLLLEAEAELRERHGMTVAIGLLATGPGGTVTAADGAPPGGGIDLRAALRGEIVDERPSGRAGALAAIPDAPIDALVEMSWFDPVAGQPATSHVRAGFARGAHAITTNKGPLAFHGPELRAEATERRLGLRYEATLMACLPVLALRESAVPVGTINAFEATPNSTTSFVLDMMAAGHGRGDAVAEAKRLGIAEADPSFDLDGWDAAVKAAILAQCLLGRDVRLADVERTGLDAVPDGEPAAAAAAGCRVRLVARGSAAGPVRVAPERVPAAGLLGGGQGTSQALAIETGLAGRLEICLVEPRIEQTAYAVLMDLVALNRDVSSGRIRPPQG
jgi:homoserine dehydrogenase